MIIATEIKIHTGTPYIIPWPIKAKEEGNPVTVRPLTIPRVIARAIPIVAKVTIKAFILTFVTKKLFRRPKKTPILNPAAIENGIFPVLLSRIALVIPLTAATEPTERSNIPVASKACIPITVGTSIEAANPIPIRFFVLKKTGLKKAKIKKYTSNIITVMDSLTRKTSKILICFIIFILDRLPGF